jgi:iduronate 2-sulfatase
MIRIKKVTLLSLVSCILLIPIENFAQENPNVLFFAIDDLKPILGCYDNKMVRTPNIDRLAANGFVFLQNYCQQAVCGPTRASLMTGRRPDHTRVWDLKTKMRDMNPSVLSIPQYFAENGYSTQGIGKVYDSRCVDKMNDRPSWTVPYHKTNVKYYDPLYGEPALNRYQHPDTKAMAEMYLKEALESGKNKAEAQDYAMSKIRPSTECLDITDNAYNDGANASQAKDILIQLSKKNEPFFFAVGFAKPHLPFVAPKKYWDLYQREEMPLAGFQQKTENAVDVAYHNAGELRAYSDIEPLADHTDIKDYGLSLPVDKQKELIHGYYAAISYTDALVGQILNTLDSLQLSKKTIVVLWGDHGWHLGDHNLWCKHTNFEEATHAPLLISAPNINPGRTKSLTEFVDIFPTLCELAGMQKPDSLDGVSLVPLMKNTSLSVKEYAISQYPRSVGAAEKERLGYANAGIMGYSMRNSRYRYTIWMKDKFRSTQPYNDAFVLGEELYDYEKDPLETKNIINEQDIQEIAADLRKKMKNYFQSQESK